MMDGMGDSNPVEELSAEAAPPETRTEQTLDKII
jgi:hypothetical protein